MLSNIIWGIIGILLAFAMVRWRKQIIQFTGSWGWAERFLGPGGSYSGVVLVAIILFIFSLLKLAGKLSSVVNNSIGKLFH